MSRNPENFTRTNGIYQCSLLQNKKIMILVPHQDDELIIVGTILPILQANKCTISVVYTTNGDYKGSQIGKQRLQEALIYCKKEGIQEDNIFFMGFGDQGETGKHIYNSQGLIKTPAGYENTYALADHPSVALKYYNHEMEYTRINYKLLLRHTLLRVLPDIIFCIDCDIHSDHMALSLMFEEVLSELIIEQNFCPKVLKAFAHDMLWMGVKDWSGINLKSCMPIEKNLHHTYAVQFQKSFYAWEERVRFPIFSRYITLNVFFNQFRRKMLIFRSQHVKYHFYRLLNSDQLFWERRTDNLIYHAKINASSGDVTCFQTMKMFECDNVMLKSGILENSSLFWHPNINDKMKIAAFFFDHPIEFDRLNIYTGFDQHITQNIQITFDDQHTINTGILKNYGKRNEIKLNNVIECRKITLKLQDDITKIIQLEVLPFRQDEILFVKLMVNANFIYKYYLNYKAKPELELYEYSTNGSRTIDQESIIQNYAIYWIPAKKKIPISHISDFFNTPKKKFKIRIEHKENPLLFDEIKIVHCSVLFRKFICIRDYFGSLLNDIFYRLIQMWNS